MKHVGFVTCAHFPLLTDSDSLIIEPLRKRGIEVEPIVWTSPPSMLINFDAIIMRSAWDYHTRYETFITFLNTLKKSKVPIFNDIDIMLWNSNKSYLLDLEKNGIPIVPTILIKTEENIPMKTIKKWNDIIIKPTIGASAHNIQKLNTTNIVYKEIITLLAKRDILIQPFIKEVMEGEISFMFFNKKFSHTMLKKPKSNDFRTQLEFGGKEERIYPSLQLLKEATNILKKIPDPLLYARLDGIVINSKFHLMELELIEPHLFLDNAPEQASMFADAIARAI